MIETLVGGDEELYAKSKDWLPWKNDGNMIFGGKMIRQCVFDPASWIEHDGILGWRGNARLSCLYEMNHGIATKSSVTGRYHFSMWPYAHLDFKIGSWVPRKAEKRVNIGS